MWLHRRSQESTIGVPYRLTISCRGSRRYKGARAVEGKRGVVCFQTCCVMFRLFAQRIFPCLPGSDARGIRCRPNYEVYSISPLDLLTADGVRHSGAEQRFTGGWSNTCHQRFAGAGGWQHQLEGAQHVQSESLSFSLSPLSLSIFLFLSPQIIAWNCQLSFRSCCMASW